MSNKTLFDTKKLRPEQEQIILLDDFDLSCTRDELNTVQQMYTEGKSLFDMVQVVRPNERGQIEVALMIMHLGCKGMIEERKGGIWGETST